MDRYGLSDPLSRLPELMDDQLHGTLSTIHGDLNLENVLVGPGDFVWLIDFAATRDGHTLFDFAHLEAQIIAHVIAPQIDSPQAYLSILHLSPSADQAGVPMADHRMLLNSLHEIASRCLFNPSLPREYHLALYMACLGALKFTNLDRHQKHLLYLTAAHLAQTL
jgi:hypothetical protein